MTEPHAPHVPSEAALDAALAALPPADMDPRDAERLRRRAQRVLAAEVDLADRPVARIWDRVWGRRVEPALLAGSSAYYLVWALVTVSAAAR
jgi:hypothetical protein